ncbi:hypothetical protein [Nocardiopsis rhodophaea]|uniref:hypothetical protein n=1 Tax=Nocardiopsis rhodophaea TaxID=280238 RepID=UPI0031D32CDA
MTALDDRRPSASNANTPWLDDELECLGIGGAAVARMAFGGRAAVDYAIQRPERGWLSDVLHRRGRER